jgi:REP-associated tyrosine transposase
MDWRVRSMRRPPVNEPGLAHELTFSCFRGFAFLQAERTCQWLAEAIEATRKERDFALWAYVFMSEHVHLLIYPRRATYDISATLQEIKEPVGRMAVAYLRSHAPHLLPRITLKRGKRLERRFWQAGGGYDRNAAEPKAALAMIEYIHHNPVRRGLVSRPEQWKWSSAGWHEGKNSLRPDAMDFGGSCLFLDGEG